MNFSADIAPSAEPSQPVAAMPIWNGSDRVDASKPRLVEVVACGLAWALRELVLEIGAGGRLGIEELLAFAGGFASMLRIAGGRCRRVRRDASGPR